MTAAAAEGESLPPFVEAPPGRIRVTSAAKDAVAFDRSGVD
jgi:hypothetical protein